MFYLKSICIFLLLATGNVALSQSYSSNFNLSGSARGISDSCFQLTPDENNRGGSVWFMVRINLNENFSVDAEINLGSRDGDGADGIAFVWQPLSNNLGAAGGGLGYQGINPSLALEFDTWQNDDPSFDHIALVRNGVVSHFQNPQNTLQGPFELLPNQANAEDGRYRPVKITWDAKNKKLQCFYNGVLKIDYSADIVSTIFGGNPYVYWGFTAATGGAKNDQRVCLKNFELIEECPDAKIQTVANVCEGDSLTLKGIGSANVIWSGPAGFTSSEKQITLYQIKPIQAGTYRLISIDAQCQDTAYANIQVLPKPTASFAVNALSQCLKGNQFALTNSSTSNSGSLTYNWDFGNGIYSNQKDPVVTYAKEGIFPITLKTIATNGCVDSTEKMITVNPNPSVTFSVNDASQCIPDNLFTFLNSSSISSGTIDYLWDFGNGNTSTVVHPEYRYLTTGTFLVKLKARSDFGCMDSSSISVSIDAQPIATARSNTPVCGGDTLKLFSTGGINFAWTGPNGFRSNAAAPVILNPSPAFQGNYTVVVNNGVCLDTAEVSVVISEQPSIIPRIDTLVNKFTILTLDLKPAGSGNLQYQWTPYASLSCNQCPNPVFIAQQDQQFTLKVSNESGCQSTGIYSVILNCYTEDLYVPNMFSPNGDNLNEFFYPMGTGIRQVKIFRVFSRWGDIIHDKKAFPLNDRKFGWNGTFKGKLMETGNYPYIMIFECNSGQIIEKKGLITLIR